MMMSRVLAAAIVLAVVAAHPQVRKDNTVPPPFKDPGGLFSALDGILSLTGGNTPLGPVPKGCAEHEIIVARGTGEPGTFGVVVGDPLVAAVASVIPNTRGYPVQYPANFDLAVSLTKGADDIIDRLNEQSRSCPNETFALVGYSQGAAAVHIAFGSIPKAYNMSALPKLDPDVLDKIKTIVLFGDPGNKGPIAIAPNVYVPELPIQLRGRLRENCAPGDPTCDPKGTDYTQHLTYLLSKYQQPSAEFIEAGFTGKPLPDAPKSAADLP